MTPIEVLYVQTPEQLDIHQNATCAVPDLQA